VAELPTIRKRDWTMAAIVAIALVAGSLAASAPFGFLGGLTLDSLTALRWRLFDNRHSPSESPTVVVALDRDSYSVPPFNGAPTVMWTREIGRVISTIVDGGAKVIGFDVIFPTSIEQSQIVIDDETVGSRLRAFDRDFLRALAGAARQNKLVLGEVQHGDDVIRPAPGQRAAVGQQANIRSLNVYSDADGVVRRTPLMLDANGANTPSMSLELASRALGETTKINADGAVSVGDDLIPASPPNAMVLNFDGGSLDIPTYSFADLRACLEKHDAEFFRRNFAGKVVLIGSTLDFEDDKLTSKRFATEPRRVSAERCAIPAGPTAALTRHSIDGVYIHATAINNLMRGEAVSVLGGLSRWLIIVAGATGATFAGLLLNSTKATLSLLLAACIWIVVATAAFRQSIGLPLLEPLVAGAMALAATICFRLLVADRDKRFLRKAFEFYLAPAVIDKMVASSNPPALGGEIRDVTVFFSDLVGFSSIAETMKPPELVALMNGYLSAMTDVIEAHGGFVDKYIGDGIVAVFGAPVETVDNAARAVNAALVCQVRLEALNRDAAERKHPTLFHRVGLNSGQALVGNIGSRRRFNYTVVGDAVNLASRLEGANKYFGTSILASEATVKLTDERFEWREVDAVRVKGRLEPVRIFEPLGSAEELVTNSPQKSAWSASYSVGLARWRLRDFAGAREAFAKWAEVDPPSALFAARANRMCSGPPDEGWEPIHNLDEK
jgi:adenylate cyclase